MQDTILSGVLRIGDPLPSERELMERYGVGRPAIREALSRLEQAGLIAINGGERARVARPTARNMVAGPDPAVRHWLADPDGVHHLQGARQLLEIALVRRAAETAVADDIERLYAALIENEAARGDLQRFERTDVAFHYGFAELSRSPIFTAIHQAMVGWLIEQRRITLRTPGAEEHAATSHRRIFEAVAAHDPAAAEREMRAHLSEVAQLYWQRGKPIDKGSVYKLLNNRIYVGEAVHKGVSYPGEHQAIAPRDLWDRVHAILTESPRARANQNRSQQPALLRGLIFGIDGRAMSPTHTRRRGRLYRYLLARELWVMRWRWCLP